MTAFQIKVQSNGQSFCYSALAPTSADAIMNATDIFGAAIITATPLEVRRVQA